jgi:glyoxylase-like metal-dependent hydrolase (beta-lactamase superfamily II)
VDEKQRKASGLREEELGHIRGPAREEAAEQDRLFFGENKRPIVLTERVFILSHPLIINMIKRISPNIVLIQLSDIDSNIYVLGDTVIDSGTGFNFTRLHSLLKIMKMNFSSVKQVVNTHGHFDHIGGNGYFLKARIAIHEKDAPILENADVQASYAEFFDGKLRPRPVDIKLKDGQSLTLNGMDFRVMHTPGHTPGSICLYDEKDGILFSGDTVFSDGVGRTDMPGGDVAQLDASLEKLSKLRISKLLPGHGEPVLEKADKVLKEILSASAAPEEE